MHSGKEKSLLIVARKVFPTETPGENQQHIGISTDIFIAFYEKKKCRQKGKHAQIVGLKRNPARSYAPFVRRTESITLEHGSTPGGLSQVEAPSVHVLEGVPDVLDLVYKETKFHLSRI
jgi:hypothetical protein